MSDIHSPVIRLIGPTEMPVRIPDWPEAVGIAICRSEGRILCFQPYHERETPMALKRRLLDAAGEKMRGFSIHPPLQGIPAAKLGPAEDLQMIADLEKSLRTIPRLVEEVHDFAINFEFADEEGLSLDGLTDQARRKGEDAPARITDHLPVGYHPFVKADPNCEVIAGAVLRPQGAAGTDLLLVPEKDLNPREIPPEANVLVREDSLRVAIALGPLLVKGQLPRALRMPAGALMLSQSGGKPVPALVLRRGGFLFVAPDYAALAQPAAVTSGPKKKGFPWLAIGLGLGAVAMVAGVVAATMWFMSSVETVSAPAAPVQNLRNELFAPVSGQ